MTTARTDPVYLGTAVRTADTTALTAVLTRMDELAQRLRMIEDDLRDIAYRTQQAIRGLQDIRDDAANLLPE